MTSIASPPVPAPKDSEPAPLPSLPTDLALWDEADIGGAPGPAASVPGAPAGSDAPASIGRIGRYALEHQLGEGGVGTVFAAHDPLLSRLIAVKTLHLEIDESERESFNALFLNEARAAGGLNHPNIVTVFDAGISDDRAYIAMELLKGRDLRQLRQEGWRATPAQAALIVRRVADALGYAHSKGVVHRDVKPANIFMIGRTQPKVLDFGIARITHRHDTPPEHPQQATDIAAGSPYYMAPEQARQETVDRRADVFSLGVVLYELLTDLKPFRGSTLEEIINAVLSHEPPLANAINPAVPEALAQIAAKALAKNPDDRHRSATAFSRELRHWLDENAVSAEGEVQTSAPRRRRTVWLVLGALGVLALGTIAWVMLGPQGVAPKTAAMPASAPPPAPPVIAAPAAVVALATVAAPLLTAVEADPAASAPTEPSAASAASSVADAASASVTASAPASVPAVAPRATVAKAPSKDAPKESAKDKRVREARERDARLATANGAAAPLPTGLVRIAISPWGEVEVDGKTVGTSPPLTELSLPAGRHQFVVRNTDLPAFSTTVNVTADQPVVLKHKF